MPTSTSIPTVLQEIVAARRLRLPEIEQHVKGANPAALPLSRRSLYDALRSQQGRGGRHFIMECKSASPSLGMIRQDYDPAGIARVYSRYAAAISVLCEPDFFHGSYQHLSAVSRETHLPVLCKDFIIDPVQVIAARYFGADAILLMLSILDDATYRELADLASDLGMDILTEVINPEEVRRALDLGAEIIGVNHRNLHDLSIDLGRSADLSTLIPSDVAVVAESGIRTNSTVRKLSEVCDGFLVGSHLTGSADLDLAARKLIYGEHKVCGLRSSAEAQSTRTQGATFGGLIVDSASPRNVSRETAGEIIRGTRGMNFAIVSRETLPLLEDAKALHEKLGVYARRLVAVQLHAPLAGTVAAEAAELRRVRDQLPEGMEIWRAIPMDAPGAAEYGAQLLATGVVQKLVLDNGQGGTGSTFDWATIPKEVKEHSLLAGGIGPTNIPAALATGVAGLDLNSGVEFADHSEKDPAKVALAFDLIRQS